MLTPADPSAHQPRPLQHLHVLGDPVERDREAALEGADLKLAPRQRRENVAARGVGDGAVDPVQLGGVLSGASRLVIIHPNGRILIVHGETRNARTPTRSRPMKHSVVSHEAWLKARTAFLVREKKFTRARDKLSEERRRLPWEAVTKTYTFDGPDGQQTLS